MTFGISPATPTIAAGDNLPATSDGFPRYIQFQANGTDLGAPDVDTVDFGSNLTATRGTGENANKVTVNAAAAGGGGTSSLVVELEGNVNGTFNNAVFSDWVGTVRNTSPDAAWNETDNQIDFTTTGVYSVRVLGWIECVGDWPANDESFYGASVSAGLPTSRSTHSRFAGFLGSIGAGTMRFSDEFIVDITSVPGSTVPGLWAAVTAYDNSGTEAIFAAVVIVQRLT